MPSRAIITSARSALLKAGGQGPPKVQLYYLNRMIDESGISGTGVVAVGIIFPNGWCAQCWLTDHSSITFFTSIEEVKAVHGHGGHTRIVVQDVTAIAEKELP